MYERNQKSFFKHFDFVILDFICMELSFWLSYLIRINSTDIIQSPYGTLIEVENYHLTMWYILGLHAVIVLLGTPYSGILRRNWVTEGRKVFIYNVYMTVGLVMIMFLTHSTEYYSRIVILMFPILDFLFMWIMREVYKHVVRSWINRGNKQDCMLLVAPREQIEGILTRFYKEKVSTVKIVGIVLMDESGADADTTMEQEAAITLEEGDGLEEIQGIPVVGNRSTLYEYARNHVVDEVMLFAKPDEADLIANTFISMGATVHICLDSLLHVAKSSLNKVNGIKVVTTYSNIVTARQMFVKRLVDICFGLAGSIVTVLLTIFVAPMIWIADPGPIFFRQERVGKNGRTFKIWKFRTMVVNADAMKAQLQSQNEVKGDGTFFKMEDDPRIIGIDKKFSVGKFLRNTSLDEFPQFFNILAGSMSLIGTRPPTMDEYEKYQLHHKGRLAIKPGLSGMWQVLGRSKVTDFEKVVQMDKFYIDHFSLALDAKIILRTIKVVLKREGAK